MYIKCMYYIYMYLENFCTYKVLGIVIYPANGIKIQTEKQSKNFISKFKSLNISSLFWHTKAVSRRAKKGA